MRTNYTIFNILLLTIVFFAIGNSIPTTRFNIRTARCARTHYGRARVRITAKAKNISNNRHCIPPFPHPALLIHKSHQSTFTLNTFLSVHFSAGTYSISTFVL